MDKMPLTRKGIKLLVVGTLVMIAGYILMAGPQPVKETFDYAMFDARRTVAAPLAIVAGVVIIIVAIMGGGKDRRER